ncbi:MAG: F0F1 ATP synthase subunit A [Spirochaetota bacterium]|jgi:F-type H+-transporting ATPase subunit a|nr:F0F1 ATP synthase subunit A [Spirochaetota bacterium]
MQHEIVVLIPFHIGSLDLSITAQVLWIFVSSILVILFGLFARRRMTEVPDRLVQHLFEITLDFIENQILEPNDLDRKRWTPLFLSLFLFIFFSNLVNIIPGGASPSGNLNTTAALSFVFFVMALGMRFRYHGPFGFFKSIIPEGIHGPMVAMLFPIEFISLLFQPISLALRLFANMMGGHTLFLTILAFAAMAHNFIIPVFSVGGSIAILLFELFICFIQAYIFTFLGALMFAQAKEH